MSTRTTDSIRLSRADGAASDLVVEGVAACLNTDPLDLNVTLYDVIDPDALDNLFQRGPDRRVRDGLQVDFRVGGCAVTVTESDVVVERDDP